MASEHMSIAVKKHSTFALRCLRLLPTPYQQEDSNRLSLAFFALSTLDLLGTLDTYLSSDEKKECVDWIYSLQQPSGGFAGSKASGAATTAHMVMSYCALLSLAILRDDFARLHRPGLVNFVSSCQTPKGSFLMYPGSLEEDVRSSYCAFVILYLLGNQWPAINLEKAIDFLKACQTYESAFAQAPGLECQGGSTYCAVAALSLAKSSIPRSSQLTAWLVQRQSCLNPAHFLDESDEEDEDEVTESTVSERQVQAAIKAASMAGFQGRPNKDPDSCYSWWIGASLRLLNGDVPLTNIQQEQGFLSECQNSLIGGISNFPNRHPDVYHTYLSLAALSLSGTPPLKPIDPAVNVSQEALQYWHSNTPS